MTNKEAYLMDLEEVEKAIEKLLQAVPTGKTKTERANREKAERVAGAAIATIHCMTNDYIPMEFD